MWDIVWVSATAEQVPWVCQTVRTAKWNWNEIVSKLFFYVGFNVRTVLDAISFYRRHSGPAVQYWNDSAETTVVEASQSQFAMSFDSKTALSIQRKL